MVMTSSWNQKNDLEVEGNYTHAEEIHFVVEIDRVGTTDTFRWSKDGGRTFVNENVTINPLGNLLDNNAYGVSVKFGSDSGHGLGDRWTFTGRPANVIIPIAQIGDSDSINGQLTRDALVHAIENQRQLGLHSLRTSTQRVPLIRYTFIIPWITLSVVPFL